MYIKSETKIERKACLNEEDHTVAATPSVGEAIDALVPVLRRLYALLLRLISKLVPSEPRVHGL